MRHSFAPRLALAVLTWVGVPCFAADPVAPATMPAAKADDVPALIKQLGSDDPKVRDAATRQLRRLGQVAVPALNEARGSDDPEVAGRAEMLVRQIQADGESPAASARRDVPRLVRPPIVVPERVARGRMIREVNTVDGGKRIKIREDAEGLTITTLEKTPGGAEVTRTTKVKDAAALKREFPELYPLYEKHVGGLGVGLAPREAEINPFDADGNIDVDRMLEEARRIVEEHRPMIEEQRRLANEQLREARRQLQEQIRQLKEEGER